MPLIELGDATKLILSIPSKGDINWSDDIRTDCFQKIVDHDHSSEKGTRVPTAGIAPDAITSALIADDQIDSEHYIAGSIDLEHMSAESVDSDQYVDASIDTEHLASSIIKVAHKFTEEKSLSGSAEDLTPISTNEAMKIHYRAYRASGTLYQVGTLNVFCTGADAGFVQDEFIGDDLSLVFAIDTNQITINGTASDEFIYSIEFKEITT